MAEVDALLGGAETSVEKWSTWRRRVRKSYARLQQSTFTLAAAAESSLESIPQADVEVDSPVTQEPASGDILLSSSETHENQVKPDSEENGGENPEGVQRRSKKIVYTGLQRATMVFEEVGSVIHHPLRRAGYH